ncbi:ABC transporter substrate-binding protein [Pseudorhodoplanes sp.]|jgi:branched-chain amino acid transport system substrate-binding protein|uniref:ABC transporter substrate-binding protein n=1 Tax=Pseudorhodoplanes sp. TaxID=1934341 RepID=UPI003D0A4D3C
MRNSYLLSFKKKLPALLMGVALALVARGALAADPGFTDTEIKIGGICPSTGPIASFVTGCAMQDAYYKYINERFGGVMMSDGKRRKINYVYYDDGYSPPRTVEQTRRLVERDQIAFLIGPLGSATGLAIRDYLNKRGVPQLMVGSGLSTFNADTDKYPWSMAWPPSYTTEGSVFAEFVKTQKRNAKVAVLYQNDDFGKELLNAFRHAAKDLDIQIVSAQSYEVTSPTVDSQILNLAASRADALLLFAVPKFAAQAMRKIQETQWRPMVILTSISASKRSVMEPAGPEASEGVYSVITLMDPTASDHAATEDMKLFRDIGARFGGTGLNPDDPLTVSGFGQAQAIVAILERAKAPTRAAIMESARHLCGVRVFGVLPGINVCANGKQDPFYFESMQVVRYSKGNWRPVGSIITKYEGKTPQHVK